MLPLLTPVRHPSEGNPTIACCCCATRAPYHDAARNGWRYDPQGPAFVAYYCAPCANVAG